MQRLTIANLFSMAARFYSRIITKFRKPAAVPPPQPVVPAVPSPPKATTTYLDGHRNPNRAERRRYEHARKRHDKFVEAGGPIPIKKPPREKRDKKQDVLPPLPAVAADFTSGNFDIVDRHHDEGQEKVLYEESEFYGEFNFRDTILDQLERYFVYLHRMKKHDPDAYGFYKQVGATIIPYLAVGYRDRINPKAVLRQRTRVKPEDLMLPPWFKATRPAFGCVAYGIDPHLEKVELDKTNRNKDGRLLCYPKFMYFTKYKQPPPELQAVSGGDVYKLTLWWDRPHDPKNKRKYGAPQEYAVFVSADGDHMQVLRMIDTEWIELRSKSIQRSQNRKGHYTKGPALRRRDLGAFHVPKRAWHIPSELEQWAKAEHCDVQEFLISVFVDAVKRIETSHYSMVRVEVKKDDAVAVFGVNVRKLAYFFQDRDTTLSATGSKERVFHMVRAHERRGQAVKFHFRGLREFDWAGYRVLITVPGRHHAMTHEIDIGSVDDYWIDKADKRKYLTGPEFGKEIAGWMHDGVGGVR